jgi:flagellar export protein FliJ
MSFRFALAPVLKLRENLEDLTRQRLENTQREIAHVAHMLESLHSAAGSMIVMNERDLSDGLPATELHFREQKLNHLRNGQGLLEAKLSELELRRKQQLTDYEEARGKRQVLSNLRDHQREAYEAKSAYRLQRAADDSFLARRGRK